jgi:acyl-CoA reductase-like NAD-dependent aldehyde dehydrogenase
MRERARRLHDLGDAIIARADEIARIEVMDTGNTIGPMRADVDKAVERIRFYAGLGSELKGETIPATPSGLHMTLREPYGVIGRIIPFNHPLGFAASRYVPAALRGNGRGVEAEFGAVIDALGHEAAVASG